MRFLCLLFLLAFAGAVAVFAVENQHEVSLSFLKRETALPVSVIVGASYLLGMLSGWSVVGMLRRSFNRAAEGVDDIRPATSAR